MSSSKLWMGARGQSDSSRVKGLNTPYVVKFHNHFPVADPKALFRFDHPNLLAPELIDNSRWAHCTWKPSNDDASQMSQQHPVMYSSLFVM